MYFIASRTYFEKYYKEYIPVFEFPDIKYSISTQIKFLK